MSIEVKTKLFASLRQGRFSEDTLSFSEGTTLSDLVNSLNIKPKELAFVLINGQMAQPDQILVHGDVVSLFPLIGGG